MDRNNHTSYIINQKSRAFTLVELLVVITIIGILIALLLPAVQAAREAARRMQCSNNFKQVGVALHNYHAAKGCFPTGWMDQHKRYGMGYERGWGWSCFILPFLEQEAVFQQIDFINDRSYGGWDTKSFKAATTVLSVYLCPSDPMGRELVRVTYSLANPDQIARTNMCGVADSEQAFYADQGWPYWPRPFPEVDGVFGGIEPCTFADIEDGASSTLAVGEMTGKGPGTNACQPWVATNLLSTKNGINGPFTVPGGTYPDGLAGGGYEAGFASFHPGGCNFTLADGSVHFLSQHIAQPILRALTTRNGPTVANIVRYGAPRTEPLISGPP